MTTPKWFEPKITIGNVIQIALLFLAAAGAYWAVIARVDGNDKDIAALQKSVEPIPEMVTQITLIQSTIATGRINRDKQYSDLSQRVDTNQSAIDAKLDKIGDAVSTLSNQVAALTATIKATSERP